MKAFVLLLTIAFASRFADVESRMTMAQITNALKTVRKSCIAKSGVAQELVDATQNGVFAEDKNLMCFYQCSMNMMKTLGKDRRFSPANADRQAETMLPEEFVERSKAVIATCYPAITSDDECEAAFQYVKCNWATDSGVNDVYNYSYLYDVGKTGEGIFLPVRRGVTSPMN